MAYYVYIIKSERTNRFYCGYPMDPDERLIHQNTRATKSTQPGIPWRLVYVERFNDKHSAMMREIEIKKIKSRRYIEELISKSLDG
jgi:putative endonuclease